jgi:hypothetical protein
VHPSPAWKESHSIQEILPDKDQGIEASLCPGQEVFEEKNPQVEEAFVQVQLEEMQETLRQKDSPQSSQGQKKQKKTEKKN